MTSVQQSLSPDPFPPLVHETPAMEAAVTALIDRVFGPGRFAKSSERLREGNTLLADCSFVSLRGGAPVGCVRMWPVTIGGEPVAFLGPLAVDPDERSAGLGQALVEAAGGQVRAKYGFDFIMRELIRRKRISVQAIMLSLSLNCRIFPALTALVR